MSRLRTLVLHAGVPESRLSYCDDWLEAFLDSPLYDADPVDIQKATPTSRLRQRVTASDLVVVLHSVTRQPATLATFRRFEPMLDARRGALLCFVGDEVNLPSAPLGDKITVLKRLRPEYIATQLPLTAGEWLYADCTGSRVVALPHALNPAVFTRRKDERERTIDLGAISVRYNGYLGDTERDDLYRYFMIHGERFGLKTDIRLVSTSNQRLTRNEWAAFLNDCLGTVSCEAGSYYLERDDATVLRILEYCTSRAKQKGVSVLGLDSFLNRALKHVPRALYEAYLRLKPRILRVLNFAGIKTASQLIEAEEIFEEIYDRFYRSYPAPGIYSKAISSRHFEAAGTMTCQIMFDGHYNGILTADEHYLALRKDFSNVDDVIDRFRDDACRHAVARHAFEHVMSNHTYARRVEQAHALVAHGREQAQTILR